MSSFSSLADEDLLSFVIADNYSAFLELRRRYHAMKVTLVNNFLYSNNCYGVSRDELLTAADEAFYYNAIKYNPSRGLFKNFARLIMDRGIKDFLKETIKERGMCFKAKSFNEGTDSAARDDESNEFCDNVGSIESYDYLFLIDEFKTLLETNEALTNKDKSVAELIIIEGFSVKETAKILKMSMSKIYYSYKKIQNLIANLISFD